MNVYKDSIIKSVISKLNEAKLSGELNLKNIYLYNWVTKLADMSLNDFDNVSENKILQSVVNEVKYKYANDICDFQVVLPTSYKRNDVTSGAGSNVPIVKNFTVTNIVQENLFGDGSLVDVYYFNINDFLSNYSDNNDGDFETLVIHRNGSTLNGSYKYNSSPTTGNIYGNNGSDIRIPKNSLSSWSFYTKDTSNLTHTIEYSIIDNNGQIQSNHAYLTVQRGSTDNLPPTIGDITITRDNRATVVITLDMLTVDLLPPYNDPEGDLIDAIRINEISTANRGIFYLDGNPITEQQIITKESVQSGLFTYVGPNQDAMWSDNFNFSVRDEGSQIWVT